MGNGPEEEAPTVEEDVAEAVAPASVVQPLEPIIEAIHGVETRIMEKLDALTAQPHHEESREDGNDGRDASPIRKPWTHRKPWEK